MIKHTFKLVFASGAHFLQLQSPFHVCMRLKSAVGDRSYSNHFSTFSSLTVSGCATEADMSHPLHVLRRSPGSSSTSFKGLALRLQVPMQMIPS